MKRLLLIFFYSLILVSISFAQLVSSSKAKSVAKNIFNERKESAKVAITDDDIKAETLIKYQNVPVFYVFNIKSDGFVIVSADKRIMPVIGYSFENNFDSENLPDGLKWLLNEYKKQTYKIITQNLSDESIEIKEAWAKYESNNFAKDNEEILAVAPLLTTKWSQGCFYNQQCPADASPQADCGRTPPGCVAVAFAQIMKYHNYPAKGLGSKSYSDPPYGTLSANFGATTYNWAAMPNSISSNNKEVATILYHCAISINSEFAPPGTNAYTTDVRKALVNNFKYSTSAQCINKTSYSSTQWNNLILGELNAQRVVMISGYDTHLKCGHAFVCDGYQTNNYFHFNWGWGGSDDGYFYLNALNPDDCAFNSQVDATIGIKPSTTFDGCSGTTNLTAASGTFSDGSGASNYNNNLSCKWLIKPVNAGSVTLNFTFFNTQSNYDKIKIYNGETTSSTLLATYSGSSIPASVTSNTGKMLVYFTTNGSTTSSGWDAKYTSAPPT
ncbi:MAG: hypothetical protein HGB12_14150, partial [Bacteroidetes bacterium]|nr:hypothetical protein [Bacteroidota bacterium]